MGRQHRQRVRFVARERIDEVERQRDAVRSYGSTEVSQGSAGGRDVFRVRLGPYTTPDAAGIVADRLKRSGYGDARVVAN